MYMVTSSKNKILRGTYILIKYIIYLLSHCNFVIVIYCIVTRIVTTNHNILMFHKGQHSLNFQIEKKVYTVIFYE